MSDTQQMRRPRLDDPEEYRIIKSIHFKETRKEWENLDPIERLERMQSKERNNNKSSR